MTTLTFYDIGVTFYQTLKIQVNLYTDGHWVFKVASIYYSIKIFFGISSYKYLCINEYPFCFDMVTVSCPLNYVFDTTYSTL